MFSLNLGDTGVSGWCSRPDHRPHSWASRLCPSPQGTPAGARPGVSLPCTTSPSAGFLPVTNKLGPQPGPGAGASAPATFPVSSLTNQPSQFLGPSPPSSLLSLSSASKPCPVLLGPHRRASSLAKKPYFHTCACAHTHAHTPPFRSHTA